METLAINKVTNTNTKSLQNQILQLVWHRTKVPALSRHSQLGPNQVCYVLSHTPTHSLWALNFSKEPASCKPFMEDNLHQSTVDVLGDATPYLKLCWAQPPLFQFWFIVPLDTTTDVQAEMARNPFLLLWGGIFPLGLKTILFLLPFSCIPSPWEKSGCLWKSSSCPLFL